MFGYFKPLSTSLRQSLPAEGLVDACRSNNRKRQSVPSSRQHQPQKQQRQQLQQKEYDFNTKKTETKTAAHTAVNSDIFVGRRSLTRATRRDRQTQTTVEQLHQTYMLQDDVLRIAPAVKGDAICLSDTGHVVKSEKFDDGVAATMTKRMKVAPTAAAAAAATTAADSPAAGIIDSSNQFNWEHVLFAMEHLAATASTAAAATTTAATSAAPNTTFVAAAASAIAGRPHPAIHITETILQRTQLRLMSLFGHASLNTLSRQTPYENKLESMRDHMKRSVMNINKK